MTDTPTAAAGLITRQEVKNAKNASHSAASEQGRPATGDTQNIYLRLRQDILSGVLPPGEILNTVHIAQKYNISRTPVREALRMLQAEKLVDAPHQHRRRVTAVAASEVDAVYASWILLQSLAVSLTVTTNTGQDLVELRDALTAMNKITPMNARSKAAWEKLHRHYNRLLIRHAGAEVTSMIEQCWLRSERARRTNMRMAPSSWVTSELAHNAMVRAFEERSVVEAVKLSSAHLAEVAFEVITNIDASFEPRAIRQALAITTGERHESAGQAESSIR